MAKDKNRKPSKKDKKFSKIIGPDSSLSIKSLLKENDSYPIFCFKYLQDVSLKDCKDVKILRDFLFRLKKISELGWSEIRLSGCHQYGMEPIPVAKIKPQLPQCVTPDVRHVDVFRASGDNHAFVGLQVGEIFRVFFIETSFGDIYDHG